MFKLRKWVPHDIFFKIYDKIYTSHIKLNDFFSLHHIHSVNSYKKNMYSVLTGSTDKRDEQINLVRFFESYIFHKTILTKLNCILIDIYISYIHSRKFENDASLPLKTIKMNWIRHMVILDDYSAVRSSAWVPVGTKMSDIKR